MSVPPEKYVLCCLLGDGTATADASSLHILTGSTLYGPIVETMVLQEVLVLTGHHRHRIDLGMS